MIFYYYFNCKNCNSMQKNTYWQTCKGTPYLILYQQSNDDAVHQNMSYAVSMYLNNTLWVIWTVYINVKKTMELNIGLNLRKVVFVRCRSVLSLKHWCSVKLLDCGIMTVTCQFFLQLTRPLQDYLGLPLDKIRRQHQAAYHLPKPLYVLYVQADAYREACGKDK
jgi:hypothetical protein